jgi:steroid delta-isomerase-like uncharacterized protein
MKKSFLLLKKAAYIVVFIPFLLCLTYSCDQQVEEGLTMEEAQNLVKKDLEIWNEGNLAMVDEIIAPDYFEHSAGIPNDYVGIDAFKQRVTDLRTEFPDFKATVEELIVKGDRIIWRWEITGTNTGSTDDMPPTGNTMEIEGVGILRVVDGKISERIMYYNQAAQLMQLGYTISMPEMEGEENE